MMLNEDEDLDGFADPEAALSLAIRKGLTLTERTIRTGIQHSQLRARDLTTSLELSPNIISSRIQEIRSLTFGSGTDRADHYSTTSSSANIPVFVLPTREHYLSSFSPQGRKRLLMKDFGAINPALYQSVDGDDSLMFPEDHTGRLWFQLAYERESEKLLVTLVKAKNLPSRADKSPCDPFARICLLPDERRTLQTKVKRKTGNPRFDECFVFSVSSKCIMERVLKFSVFDIDRRKKHNLIGQAAYPLVDFDVNSDKHPTVFLDLDKEISEIPSSAGRGELLISMCYNMDLQRLTINVVEGKNFRTGEKSAPIDSFVQISLKHQSRLVKRKKTQTVRANCNPQFNESFQFKLPPKLCDAVSVLFVAEVKDAPKSHRSLGRILLGGFMFARGKELEHWQAMMQTEKEHVQQWHTLSQI
ncbi:Synaptotagmin-15 [Hypsibius exemplaris]|uniref:Synaptotagmin-15 n=1 Tax=Hypsibius exemplaris TaxID=2072580 RepID=A0A1W0WHQ7_HYPEX|nr:Synaptotagmin-15 [Hypsibius exemplaris]